MDGQGGGLVLTAPPCMANITVKLLGREGRNEV